jgi:hypothetical protein
MTWDGAVDQAKKECTRFLALAEVNQTCETIGPVLKSIDMVLAAMNFYTAMDKNSGVGVRVFKGVDVLADGVLYTHTQLFYKQDGAFIQVLSLACKEGCHTLEEVKREISLEEVQGSGVKLKAIVTSFNNYLAEPNVGLPNTQQKYLN